MSIDDLDNLMKYLYEKRNWYTKYRDIVSEHFNDDETNNDPQALLIKLTKDGYVDTGSFDNGQKYGWTFQTTYKLSFEGLLQYENSSQNKPYLGQKRKARLNKIWEVAKTVITILNSVAILYLMWKAIPNSP